MGSVLESVFQDLMKDVRNESAEPPPKTSYMSMAMHSHGLPQGQVY